jgi:hypothetical protein
VHPKSEVNVKLEYVPLVVSVLCSNIKQSHVLPSKVLPAIFMDSFCHGLALHQDVKACRCRRLLQFFSKPVAYSQKHLKDVLFGVYLTFQRCYSRHITRMIVPLMRSKDFVAQQCVPAMTLGHFCTNIATRMMEAQACTGLVAKAREGWPVGQSPWSTSNQASIFGEGLCGKGSGVKYKIPVEARRGVHYLGVSPGGAVPGRGLAPWMEKPFGGSTDPPETWMI